MRVQPFLPGRAAEGEKLAHKGHVCTGLAVGAKGLQHGAAVDAVHAHAFVAARIQLALGQQTAHELDGAQLGQQAGIEGDFVHALHDFLA